MSLFREPIVALRIKKSHRPAFPGAALNIGTLVPILFLLPCITQSDYRENDDARRHENDGTVLFPVRWEEIHQFLSVPLPSGFPFRGKVHRERGGRSNVVNGSVPSIKGRETLADGQQ